MAADHVYLFNRYCCGQFNVPKFRLQSVESMELNTLGYYGKSHCNLASFRESNSDREFTNNLSIYSIYHCNCYGHKEQA